MKHETPGPKQSPQLPKRPYERPRIVRRRSIERAVLFSGTASSGTSTGGPTTIGTIGLTGGT